MGRRTLLVLFGLAALVAGPPLVWLAGQREARVVAVRAADGRVDWSAAIEPERPRERAIPYRQAAGDGRLVLNVLLVEEGAGSRDDRVGVVAFGANGARLWAFAPAADEFGELLAGDTAWVAPQVADDAVYVTLSVRADRASTPTPDRLVALDAVSGRVRWTFSPVARRDTDRYSAAVPAGDLLIVPTRGDAGLALAALDAASGRPVWRAELGDARLIPTAAGPVVAADDGVVAVLTESGVVAFDARSGARRFAVPEGSPYGQLWLERDALYVSGPENRSLVAFDAATGAPRWTFRPDGLLGTLHAFRAEGDALYAWCACRAEGEQLQGAQLLAVDAGTGRERWRTSVWRGMGQFAGAPAFAPGLVVVADDDAVAALGAADGIVRWRAPNVRTGAAVDGERVYVTRSAPRWRHWLAYLDQRWADDD